VLSACISQHVLIVRVYFPLQQLHHLVEKMEDELTPEGKAIMELLVAAGADLDINNNIVRFSICGKDI